MISNFKKAEILIFGFLLFTLVWLPLPLGSNRPWAWALMQISFFLITALLCLTSPGSVLVTLKRYKVIITLWVIFIGLQAFLLIPLPQELVAHMRPERVNPLVSLNAAPAYSLSFDTGQSYIALFKSLSFFCLFLALLTLVKSIFRLKILIAVLGMSGLVQAFYGAFEVLSGIDRSLIFDLPVSHIATGSFIYKNHFANYLLLTLSAAIGYLISTLKATPPYTRKDLLRHWVSFWLSSKVVFRLAIICMVIALVMSRSRMGNSSFFISMTLTACIGFFYFKPRLKSYTLLFVSMLVIDIAIISSIFGLKEVQTRIEQTSIEEETRDEIIVDSIPLISKYSALGAGGGSFYTMYPKYQSSQVNLAYDHAHNEYLQFFIEFGAIGFLSLFFIVGMCLTSSLKALKRRRHNMARGAAFASFMAIIGMALHASVDFPLQAPANAATFICLLTIGLISNQIKAPVKSRYKGYA